ncbi:MAG: TrmB family transcriptional regulator [Calditrichaeota bacterium]|nr:TrmB family transcriptional regulator [Calditrichota bacterium]
MTINQITEELEGLGLSKREANLYLALLSKSEFSVSELHRTANVPRTKIYDTLDRMVNRGYCTVRIEGRKRFFKAISPEIVLDNLEEKLRKELLSRLNKRDLLQKKLDQFFNNEERQNQPIDIIEIHQSPDLFENCILKLVGKVEQELLALIRPPWMWFDEKSRSSIGKAVTDAINRGVRIRTIDSFDSSKWNQFLPQYKENQERGEEQRIIMRLPVKQFIFDRKTVVTALPTCDDFAEKDFSMLVVHDVGFAETAVNNFEYYWDKSLEPKQWQLLIDKEKGG